MVKTKLEFPPIMPVYCDRHEGKLLNGGVNTADTGRDLSSTAALQQTCWMYVRVFQARLGPDGCQEFTLTWSPPLPTPGSVPKQITDCTSLKPRLKYYVHPEEAVKHPVPLA